MGRRNYEEYPNFSIVGEEWNNNPLIINYWHKDSKNRDGYSSNLKFIMDLINQFMRKLVLIKQISLILFLQVFYQKIIIIKSLEMQLKY